MNSIRNAILLVAATVGCLGCFLSHGTDEEHSNVPSPSANSDTSDTPAADEADGRGPTSGALHTSWSPPDFECSDGTAAEHPDVDLLVVLDTSQSMEHFHPGLGMSLPLFVERMLSDDSFPAPRSLRVGFISTDAATHYEALGTRTDCHPGAWFEFPSDRVRTMEELRATMECISQARRDGHMIEQSLEATLQALQTGNFLRRESILSILWVTNEDDCSLLPIESTLPASERCEHSGELHPVERYVDGLRALRPEGRMAVSLIGPVFPGSSMVEYEQLLATSDNRLVRVLSGLDNAATSLQSIYQCVDPEEYCDAWDDDAPDIYDLDRGPPGTDGELICNPDHPCPALAPNAGLAGTQPFWRGVGALFYEAACSPRT